MFGFLLVMKAEIVRSWIIMRRYWFRTLTGLIIGYGMLVVLVMGFMASSEQVEQAMSRNFESAAAATNFVLGFIIGMFAFGVVGMFTQGLQGMARTGILEQLCMSPHGLITNFMARSIVSAVTTIASSAVMVYMVSLTFGEALHFHPAETLLLLTLTFINLLGFGFMMGGLVLVFKQVGQVAILIRMMLFGLAIYANEDILHQGRVARSLMHALPITDAAICLKHVLIKDHVLADGTVLPLLQHPSLFYLVLSCLLWTGIGIACFKSMENWSRARGTLGAY